MKNRKIKVIELFAGVGGFRLGLEGKQGKRKEYKVIWSNQWEPNTKKQHATESYIKNFGDKNHSNEDISKIPTEEIPDHDLLTGGFPCQDYSVARTKNQATGIKGKKGVLWWEIHRILKEKGDKSPELLLLENVDRLLKSPSDQRGRDFAIMLSSLSDLGYALEWRVINAADYGMPQKRRRVFLMGYKNNSKIFNKMKKPSPYEWLIKDGVISSAFKVKGNKEDFDSLNSFNIKGNLVDITNNFGNSKDKPFGNSGIMINRKVYTIKTEPKYKGDKTFLKNIIQEDKNIPEEYYITNKEIKEWKYQKGAKKKKRTSKDGYSYYYSEGSMKFPDPLNSPSRTIVTGEGGRSPSRFKHIIKTKNGRYRRLTPVELERLCMFPDNHTEGHTPTKRAFLMGNALVVGVVEKIGIQILKHLNIR
ncbi:MAG: DNA (cytosine-5-)-methyltransferase [Candidatus Paceibacterota bacterium]